MNDLRMMYSNSLLSLLMCCHRTGDDDTTDELEIAMSAWQISRNRRVPIFSFYLEDAQYCSTSGHRTFYLGST